MLAAGVCDSGQLVSQAPVYPFLKINSLYEGLSWGIGGGNANRLDPTMADTHLFYGLSPLSGIGFCYVAYTGLELIESSDPSASAS